MRIKIVDYNDREKLLEIEEVAGYLKSQAFVAFYDHAGVKTDNRMQPMDWAVSTLLQAPIRRYSPFEDLFRNDSALIAECETALRQIGPDVPLESDEAMTKESAVQSASPHS